MDAYQAVSRAASRGSTYDLKPGGRLSGPSVRAALTAWRETRSDLDFRVFRDLAMTYIDFETRHAMKENDHLIPIAEKALTYEDWETIEAAFENNQDPACGR